MTREDARRILDRHRAALNRHDVAALSSLYTTDAVLESPMFSVMQGRDAVARSFERLFAVFPDYSITLRDPLFIWDRDRAVEFSTVEATQRAPLFGLPATGQPIAYQAARLFTFRDGLIAYEQRIYDFGGLLERLEKVRLDHELRTAATLQQMLMAHTDLVGDFFEVARVSIPCRAIGGDFLEYHHIPRVSLGLALGDVSGKGAPAALVAAMLHGMLAMAADGFSAPDTLLHRLNEALRRRELAERYATLCYAVLSFDGRLTYANAGHPPPLLVTGQRVEPLTAGGPILGVFESSQFPSDTVTLAPGDSVVFYSDGLTEAVSPTGEEFGIERVMTEIAEHAHAKPAALVTRLLTTLQQFASTATSVDDATIAVLTYRPGRGELASY